MTLIEYQAFTNTTNCYPKDNMLDCLVMGLCNEAGEVAGKCKKYYRDGKTMHVFRAQALDEMGDVCWYLSELATYFDTNIEEILDINRGKITKRVMDGTIKGDGDNR